MTQKLSDLAATEERRNTVREAAARFLRREWSLRQLRERVEQDGRADAPALWKEMRALEWDRIGLAGDDIGAAEVCAIVEEAGSAMAPTPLVACNVGRALLLGSGASAAASLPVLAHAEARRWTDPLRTTVTATGTASGFQLDGEKRFVVYGAQADLVIVSADVGGELGLFAVDAVALNLQREPLALLDASPCAALTLHGVVVPKAARIASGGRAEILLSQALALETVARSTKLVGVGARALELAVEYAKERVAFGRPIGSFQAVQHKLVNLRASVEVARALYQGAAAQLAAGSEHGAAVAMAAFAALDELRKVPEGALQVFGGIGTTWEHDIHLLVRRAATLCALLGERGRFRHEIARHLIDSRPNAELSHDE
jgi:alkylation response protein AidB-like acyl-CoA dehydrogenase